MAFAGLEAELFELFAGAHIAREDEEGDDAGVRAALYLLVMHAVMGRGAALDGPEAGIDG